MTLYLMISEDEAYTRKFVTPDELKAASDGELQIFELVGIQDKIAKYCPINDHFENKVPEKIE